MILKQKDCLLDITSDINGLPGVVRGFRQLLNKIENAVKQLRAQDLIMVGEAIITETQFLDFLSLTSYINRQIKPGARHT